MTRSDVMRPFARSTAFVSAIVLAVSVVVPALLVLSPASADQLDSRFIDMSANQTSEGSGRDGGDAFGQDVTYRVGFDVAQAHANIEGIVIDFCSNSPLLSTICTAPAGFNINEGTLAIVPVTGVAATWTVHANSDANTVIITKAGGDALSAGDPVVFDLGSVGAADGITNPSANGTFYARIVTYTDDTVAPSYVDTAPGTHVDDGGVALAVANELTVTARVQEILQFCVGTADANSASDCTDISGTSVDLGVVDSSAVNTTTGAPSFAMIRTNAFYGASVYYKAEQDTAFGKLKIAGAACTNNVTQLDRCFNSAIGSGTTSAPVGQAIVAGTEAFGMTLTGVDVTNGGATGNLARNAAYDGDGTSGGACTAADAGVDEPCWAWADSGVFDTIASSSSVLDDEMVTIAFAATAAATTPTGLYNATANFVATATF